MSLPPSWVVGGDLEDTYAEAIALGADPSTGVLSTERMTRKFIDTKKNAGTSHIYLILLLLIFF